MYEFLSKIVGDHNSILYFLNTFSQVVATLFAIITTLTIFKLQFSKSSLNELEKFLYSLVNKNKSNPPKNILGNEIIIQLAESDGSFNDFYIICINKINEWKNANDNVKYCNDEYTKFELFTIKYKKELDERITILEEVKLISLFSIILIGISLFSITFSTYLAKSNCIFELSILTIIIVFKYLFKVYKWTIKIIT